MKTAIIRADGSPHLGMGHIMRCVAVAAGLAEIGIKPIFVIKSFDPCVAGVIRSQGYDVEEISCDGSYDSSCDWTYLDDARTTREIGTRVGAGLMVIDVCHRPALANVEELLAYHSALAPGFFTVGIASGELMDLPADVVVSPYMISRNGNAGMPVGGARTLLLGPAYFIFRAEFTAAALLARTINREGRRVLVIVGGSDDLHLTAKIVTALCRLPGPLPSLRVVLGAGYSELLVREVKELLGSYNGEYALVGQNSNLAEEMLWADLAITGDGLTKYETAVTGTPSIMLSRPESESSLNQEFEKAGTTLHLGDGCLIPLEELSNRIRGLLDDEAMRVSMSRMGKVLVDGKGLERIISCIPHKVLHEVLR